MWEIIGGILLLMLIVAAWCFLVPAAAFAGSLVSIVLGCIAVFKGIRRGVTDTFDETLPMMEKLYYDGKEPAKKSWFFGPAFMVFPYMFRHTWKVMINQSAPIADKWLGLMEDHGWLVKVFVAPIGAVILAVIWVVGIGLAAIFGLTFSLLFALFLLIFFLFYLIVKGIDGIILRARGYKNHCKNCNEVSLVPKFVCPHCGEIHEHLTPNKYGVFNHQCTCGAYLGSTYFSGKGMLHSICPFCGENFKTSATKPFTLQLIGGTSSGKTVYLAALMKEINALAKTNKVKMTDDPACADILAELKDFADGKGDPAATQGRDTTFYAEVVDMGNKTPIKFEIVDIPGEMFAGETALQEGLHKMSQYQYADGFLFLVDPFADGDLINAQPTDGTAVSPISPTEVLHNFDSYLIAQRFAKTGQLITKPLSVIVVKADTDEVKKQLTMEMIEEEFQANPGAYNNSFDQCRDDMIKQMLVSLSQGDLVSSIEARFKNAHFFLASAMGHAPEFGKKYQPKQVLESTSWIIEQSNPALYNRLNGK